MPPLCHYDRKTGAVIAVLEAARTVERSPIPPAKNLRELADHKAFYAGVGPASSAPTSDREVKTSGSTDYFVSPFDKGKDLPLPNARKRLCSITGNG